MSAISALFQRSGKQVDPHEVRMMLASARHRSPDGMRVYCESDIALGHGQMRVTPEDVTDRQLLVSRATGCVITADMRLDNRNEIAAVAGINASVKVSDSELVLRGYESAGEDVIAKLLGDFAFIIWDPRRQSLVCARDSSGQRRIFYRVNSETFAAASEIQQLFQDRAVPIRPNEERIFDSLLPQNVMTNPRESAETFFEGIRLVPAGHVLTVGREVVSLQRFWNIDPSHEITHRRHEEYAEHFRAIFWDAVQARTRVAGSLGAFLSGGLDSSSIACTAQSIVQDRASHNHIHTFTLTFPDLDCDELPLVRSTVEKSGVMAQFLPVGNMPEIELDASGLVESPYFGVGPMYAPVFTAAMDAGIRVVLSGELADNCIGGSRLVFDSLLRKGRFREFRYHWRPFARHTGDSILTAVALNCIAPLFPLSVNRLAQKLYMHRYLAHYGHRLVPGWFAPDFRTQLAAATAATQAKMHTTRHYRSPARQYEYDLLYPPEDTSYAASWQVEVWRPFADRRLHEFLLAVPPEEKFRPHPESDDFYAGSKRLLRDAMDGVLPDDVRLQWKKNVFTSALHSDLRNYWSLYESLFALDRNSRVSDHGYVDQYAFYTWLKAMRDGNVPPDLAYFRTIVRLETWLRSLEQPRRELVSGATTYAHRTSDVGGDEAQRAYAC